MAFEQLTYRESLRDIESCLRSQRSKLYHMGIRGNVSRNTLANANKVRDWRIYADFAHCLIQKARALYLDEDFGVQLDQTVYAAFEQGILCLRGKSNFKFCRQYSHPVSDNVAYLRSKRYANRLLFCRSLSGENTQDQISRCRLGQDSGISYQQFHAFSNDDSSTISMPMASGTLFQVDQTEPQNQEFLRNKRQRNQNSGLDRCVDICSGSNNNAFPVKHHRVIPSRILIYHIVQQVL